MSFHRNGEKSLVMQKKELKEEMLFLHTERKEWRRSRF